MILVGTNLFTTFSLRFLTCRLLGRLLLNLRHLSLWFSTEVGNLQPMGCLWPLGPLDPAHGAGFAAMFNSESFACAALHCILPWLGAWRVGIFPVMCYSEVAGKTGNRERQWCWLGSSNSLLWPKLGHSDWLIEKVADYWVSRRFINKKMFCFWIDYCWYFWLAIRRLQPLRVIMHHGPHSTYSLDVKLSLGIAKISAVRWNSSCWSPSCAGA